MLARETSVPFDDLDWIYEVKWDGYRAISEIDQGEVKLYSRNGNDYARRYLKLAGELGKLEHNVIMDGEVVVLNEEGYPDFQKMQHYEDNTNFPLVYYVFDLLFLDGQSTMDLPLIERKKLLKELLPSSEMIRYSAHLSSEGTKFFEASTEKGLEGIMAKRASSTYVPGVRTNDWLKVKNHKTAEVIIAGYTLPEGSRKFFGSLVLGMMKEKELVHVGQTGTGFNTSSLKDLFELMQPLIISKTQFRSKQKYGQGITWIKPTIICEVKFSEWTKDLKLRQPVFLKLRNDKPLKSVNMKAQFPVKKEATTAKKNSTANDEFFIMDKKIKVPVSHPDKIYFPEDKVTKKMVVEYYQSVADFILPFLKNRCQSLNRNPNGIYAQGFYHKDAGEGVPGFIKTFEVHSESTNKEIDYIICNNKATLAYLNNLGCIELNPWHSPVTKPGHPDYMIIDIDPSKNNTFEQVIETANAFKKVFDKAGAKCFCKTSGASGLHIYLPMKQKYTYEEVKNFAQITCIVVNDMLPEFTTMERNLKKRGDNKIYLDYLQNRSGQTIASVYSLRPKKGATVSMPLHWGEVKKGLSPRMFHINNALERIEEFPDLFTGIMGPATNIAECLKKLNG